MKRIKYIDPFSTGRIFAALYAFVGLIFGIVFMVMSFFYQGEVASTGIATMFLGIGAPVVLTIMYGFFGFVFGYFGVWFYNRASKWVGTIKVELEEVDGLPLLVPRTSAIALTNTKPSVSTLPSAPPKTETTEVSTKPKAPPKKTPKTTGTSSKAKTSKTTTKKKKKT